MSHASATLDFHRFCLVDRATDAFRRALVETVKPGDVVVDLGAGTGVLAYFACQADARRVYAIEASEAIKLASDISLNNGFQEQVVLLQDMSYRVQLPEQADLLVTNTLESFGINGGILKSVIDARDRFLREDCVIIPRALELFVAPVELPDTYQEFINFWADEYCGLDFSSVRRFAANNNYPIKLDRTPFLSEPTSVTHINLYEVNNPEVCADISFFATRSGVMHGFVGWFAAELAENIRFSNEPGLDETSYNQTFFPLERPVELDAGDRLSFHIHTYNGETWRWRIERFGRLDSGEEVRKTYFDQSEFLGFPLSKEDLRKKSSQYKPKLSDKGQAELFILEALDGERTIGQIANELIERFPDSFHSLQDASALVRDTSERCA